MISSQKRSLARLTAFLAAATIVACQSSDRLPPKGSTITVAANPATIPLTSSPDCLNLLQVSTCGTADVVATVASELGVPLPDQDVRFSSTAGFLYTGPASSPTNAANIPIRTDKFGNASVNLITAATATVTAKSGQATAGTLSINTVAGNLSGITLNFDTTTAGCSPDPLGLCTDSLCFKAQAVDSSSNGIKGVIINFVLQNNVFNGNTLDGQFTNSQQTTDVNGFVSTKFTPTNTGSTACSSQCSAASSKQCQAQVVAQTTGGAIQSGALNIHVNAP